MIVEEKPLVGIGACLTAQAVRYDGSAKALPEALNNFPQRFSFAPFCPETAIGLSVPRPPIQIIDTGKGLRVKDVATGQHDYSAALAASVQAFTAQHPSLCGYIGVFKSPSCGVYRVKRHTPQGQVIARDSAGLFVTTLAKQMPTLPVADDTWLSDSARCDSFIARVHLRHDSLALPEAPSPAELQSLYRNYKYLLMAHHPPSYRTLGQRVANYHPCARTFTAVLTQMHFALGHMASRKQHANTLAHIAGYYRKSLSSEQRQEIAQQIDCYRNGILARDEVLQTLLHWQSVSPVAYLCEQKYLAIARAPTDQQDRA